MKVGDCFKDMDQVAVTVTKGETKVSTPKFAEVSAKAAEAKAVTKSATPQKQ